IVIALPNLYYANLLVDDFLNILTSEQDQLFPVDEVLSAELAFSSPEARADRVSAFNFLMTANAGIVVVPDAGLRKYLPT
ncbi:hypothetical protein ACPTJE_18015, partial [Enterococcus faecalis]|uniref:hypothetical protein n=1 Tax=Enterococcus faecalis TaxID=1351 RepID=UPI003CC5E751